MLFERPNVSRLSIDRDQSCHCRSPFVTDPTRTKRQQETDRGSENILKCSMALDGADLAWIAEDRVAEHLGSGALVRVLADWVPAVSRLLFSTTHAEAAPAALTALITTLGIAK